MEFQAQYVVIGVILWALFAAFWWGFLPVFGDKSYVEVFGLIPTIVMTIVLLPVSYFIVHMIAER